MTTSNKRQGMFTQEEREREIALTTKWHAVFKALREALSDDEIETMWENGLTIAPMTEDGYLGVPTHILPPVIHVTAARPSPLANGPYRTTSEDLHYDYAGLYDRGE